MLIQNQVFVKMAKNHYINEKISQLDVDFCEERMYNCIVKKGLLRMEEWEC